MLSKSICFQDNLSIGLLDVATLKFSRVDHVGADHPIFATLQAPFDWYYHEKILMIPDPVATPRKNWSQTIVLCGTQEIECAGEFIAFFHFEERGDWLVAQSLTLPEFEHIKTGIEVR